MATKRLVDEDAPTEALPRQAQKDIAALFGAMERLEDKQVPFKAMIYGDPGTAKTTQSMQIAQSFRKDPKDWILYFDTGQGWTSLKNRPELMEGVRRVAFENVEQLKLYAEYSKHGNPQIQELYKHLVCVVFDEYTNMMDRDLHWIVRVRSEQAAAKGDFKDPHNPALPDYLSQKVRSGEVLNAYMDMDCHVIFVGHPRIEKLTGKIGPDLPNKTASDLVRLLHGMYYATVVESGDKVEFRLQMDERVKVKGAPRQAKNRIGGLGSFASVSEIIEAYKKWGVQDTPVGKETITPETNTELEVPEVDTDTINALLD